jgi:hypothetical protein
MINKVATTHCSFLRLQIKREDISTNAVSVTKTQVYTILQDVCIVSRDVCIVSNRLTCIDSKLSEMEILAQPLSLPFIIENLKTTTYTDTFPIPFRQIYIRQGKHTMMDRYVLMITKQRIFLQNTLPGCLQLTLMGIG